MLLSVNEAAEWLGIGRTRLSAEVAAGRIEPVRIGNRVLYPKATLESYVELLIAEAAGTANKRALAGTTDLDWNEAVPRHDDGGGR